MLKAKKSLSQNFLIDNNISKKILKYTDIKGKKVLEIGPGYGFLTDKILQKKPKKLILIEKDFNLTVYLKNKYKENKNIIIICADILKFDLNKYKITFVLIL